MAIKGFGYSVGPDFELEGPMCLAYDEGSSVFNFRIFEDRDWDPNDRRRENSVNISVKDAQEMAKRILKVIEFYQMK